MVLFYGLSTAQTEAGDMAIKFSEDVVPLTDLKTNPGRIVRHVTEAHRPVLLTSRGRGVAVVQSIADYESAEEERAFMRVVVDAYRISRPVGRSP